MTELTENQKIIAKNMSEAELQENIIEMALTCGWRVHAERRVKIKREDGSVYHETPIQGNAGFPDLVLVNRLQVHYAELKSETGDLSGEQKEWIRILKSAHVPNFVHVWKPSQWVSGEIESILKGE